MLCRFPDMYDYGSRGSEGDLIDSAGIVRRVFVRVKVDGHSEAVLEALEALKR